MKKLNFKIFKFDIIDSKTGVSYSPSEIYKNLKQLVNSVQENGIGLGIMTSENRDVWYEVYTELSKGIIQIKKQKLF